MYMPETAMNEDDGVEAREYQVRRSRKAPVVQSVPETQMMDSLAQTQFRTGVLSAMPHAGHDARSRRLVDCVQLKPA